MSIDGLLPDSYLAPDTHGLEVPTLRRLVAQGAYSTGAQSVFPSVTYPAHTSIATGVTPAHHGIHGNRAFDPLDLNLEGWRWYAEDIRKPPIWQIAQEAGKASAVINWPVSVGAQVSWLVPEYWRARTEDDRKLLRALSTPGLLDAVATSYPGFWDRFAPPIITDEAGSDIAHHLLTTAQPALLMLHIFQVDSAQHEHGLWSPQALAAIEHADRQLGRLPAAIDTTRAQADTLFMVSSDHGFVNVARQVQPGVLLRDAGLVSLDEQGRLRDYRAALLPSGGQAYVYLRDAADSATAVRVTQVFAEKLAEPGSGLARMYDRAAIAEVGGDPDALLALEAEPGVVIGGAYDGEYTRRPSYAAAHGYDPRRPELRASLLWMGPGIPPGPRQKGRLVDVAPTIARWLGIELPSVDGSALE